MKRKLSVLLPLLCLAVLALMPTGNGRGALQTVQQTAESCSAGVLLSGENVKVSSRFLELLMGSGEELMLIPGGEIFGTRVTQPYVSVSDNGEVKALKHGDIILSVDGEAVGRVSDVKDILENHEGDMIDLSVRRDEKDFSVRLPYSKDKGIGITLSDGAAGIGTVTYVEPNTKNFGGLGHGICDSESGEPIEIICGSVTGVILGGVKRGESGKPGELSGILTDKTKGTVSINTERGVFGTLDSYEGKTPIPVAKKSEVHSGDATIICTVKNGKTAEYKVKLFEIDKGSTGTKCFKIKVCDQTLLALTGGIVRGMSGSPIIQDGKLIGAVTHVMVADPTEGYGIFIENMLSASGAEMQPKAA